MQNRVPVHPTMKCLQAPAPSIRLSMYLSRGLDYRRTVDHNQIVGRSDWANMSPDGKHPRTDTPGGKIHKIREVLYKNTVIYV